MKVTKLQAAEAQLDAAIDHFLRDEWVPAIHCAGAAEELCGRLLEKLGGKTMPDNLWERHDYSDLVGNRKEFINVLNLFRDWVKHTNAKHADEMEIDEPCALFSIQRAVNAYMPLVLGLGPWRASIVRFNEWLDANEDRLDKLIDSLPES